MESSSGETEIEVGQRYQLDVLFAGLAHSDRRCTLRHLQEKAPSSLTHRDLATYLVPAYPENPRDVAAGDRIQRALTKLHHTHLPKLEEAGLIERENETVSTTDHPAFVDPGILVVIGDAEPADGDSLDALFEALADHRRRTILDVLSHQFGPIHVETLAREIGAKEGDTIESEVPSDVVEEILVSLRHLHLPRLSDADLIEHDADEGMVDYNGHPELRVPWTHSMLAPDFRPSLTGESDLDGIGTINGREQVISFGQSLCDRAQEELFCMFTDTDLLEAGCLTRIRDAANERDVTIYLGTCDPTIREYIQENAPEVILWEPATNWLNLPVAGNNVGRLLLADREAVMLGTLGDEMNGEFRVEQSLVGEGTDNPLVVMVTQLLSPYLEAIDNPDEDLEARLPF